MGLDFDLAEMSAPVGKFMSQGEAVARVAGGRVWSALKNETTWLVVIGVVLTAMIVAAFALALWVLVKAIQ